MHLLLLRVSKQDTQVPMESLADLGEITLFELEVFNLMSQSTSIRSLGRQSKLKPAHVSKILKRLEEKTGKTLIQRSSTGALFTPEGEEFLKTARAILKIMSEEAVRQKFPDLKQRKLMTIGSSSYLNTYLLPRCLGMLSHSQPTMRFRLLDIPASHISSAGLKGRFEMALHIGNVEWTPLWSSRHVGDLGWSLFGRGGHPLGLVTTEEKVRAFPFIVPSYFGLQSFQFGSDRCPLSMSERIHGHEVPTAETALQIAKFTDELVFAPRIVAQRLVDSREIQEIKVEDWRSVNEPLFLSVRNDIISQKLFNEISTKLKAMI